MRMFLTSTAIVLVLAGTSFAVSTPASAADFSVRMGNGYGHDYGRDRSRSAVSVSFGDVAFGYRDGYWDNGHRWHRWNNDRDYQNYRSNHTGYYRDWNHDRDGSDGWARDGRRSFDSISFGYRDGYWDNSHRWHRWSNDRSYRNYRSHYSNNYRDWNHDRDGNDGGHRNSDHRDNGRGH